MKKKPQTGRIAYCDARGVIGFGEACPKGTLPIIRCPDKAAEEQIAVMARHAYDGETLLVPGVPEAANQNAAVDALLAFNRWVAGVFQDRQWA